MFNTNRFLLFRPSGNHANINVLKFFCPGGHPSVPNRGLQVTPVRYLFANLLTHISYSFVFANMCFPIVVFFVLSARIRGQPAGGKPLTTTTLSEGGALRRISLYRLCLQESRLREARPEDSIIVKDIYVLEPLINTTPHNQQ